MGYSLRWEKTPRTKDNAADKIISEYMIDAVADLSDLIDLCAPGSIAYTPDLATVCAMAPTGQWFLPATVPLLITTQPEDVAAETGADAGSLSVVAYTNPAYTLEYQWCSVTTADSYSTGLDELEGEDAATLALGDQLSADTYYYFCALTANGVTINSAIATVVVATA